MAENKIVIPYVFDNHKVEIIIFGESTNGDSIIEIDKVEAIANGEATVQIKEGFFYEYHVTNGFSLLTTDIVSQSKVNPSSGRISPNIYVGTLTLHILNSIKVKCGELKLEVQSVKTSYRKDYRYMLGEITDKCLDLLLQPDSPVTQTLRPDPVNKYRTEYQRFAFLKSIIESEEFNDSVHKILYAPVTRWKEFEVDKDIRGIRHVNNKVIRQIVSATNRMELPSDHPLTSLMKSIPRRINVTNKSETVDTPENRFVKHALSYYLAFIGDFRGKVKNESRLYNESTLLSDKLEQYLNHSIFKKISRPATLPLNSPVLQRKEGYREMLRTWLMFELAAKLIWQGGDDVYSGDKRDVAVLYEYWLFFKLLEIIKEVFNISSSPVEELIEKTADGLGLKLKQGRFLPVKGVFINESRKLNIEFSYNKTFSGEKEYPKGGSWTRNLRPDYTLSIWPFGIEQNQAEEEELIVHVHFDAKYKIENLQTIFDADSNLEEEKEEQKKGTYKRADLLKMHTYRDAIRRTAGAYVLYPGFKVFKKFGFHEVLPGLGAFAIRPSENNDGTEELKRFLQELVQHFLNRASQREKMSLKTYETHHDQNISEVKELLPDAYGKNRALLPDETYVLVGFYKSPEHLEWIRNNGLYNTRTGSDHGSLRLSPKESGARYLLLHTYGEIRTSRILKLKGSGPRIFSKYDLIALQYPEPRHDFYLIYDIDEEVEKELEGINWDITMLTDYKVFGENGLPFSISITELMKVKLNS